MGVECRHAADDERRHTHHDKKTHRFKVSRHDSAQRIMRISRWQDLMANLAPGRGKSAEKRVGCSGGLRRPETRRSFSPLDLLRSLDDSVFLGPVPKRGELCRRLFERSSEMRPVFR